jgi:hypothetical protein
LGTSRFARLLDSYRLATKQPPPPGLVLVHNQLSSPTPAREKSLRAWWAKPAAEIVPCSCGWRPDLGDHHRVHRPGPVVRRTTRHGGDLLTEPIGGVRASNLRKRDDVGLRKRAAVLQSRPVDGPDVFTFRSR